MSLMTWLVHLMRGKPLVAPLEDVAKERLTTRQLDIASRLARMKGVTRDDVLREAYRRADRIVANKQ